MYEDLTCESSSCTAQARSLPWRLLLVLRSMGTLPVENPCQLAPRCPSRSSGCHPRTCPWLGHLYIGTHNHQRPWLFRLHMKFTIENTVLCRVGANVIQSVHSDLEL